MKAKIGNKEFESFKLEINVESENDLIELFHRFNIGQPFMTDYMRDYKLFSYGSMQVFDILETKIRGLGIELEK